MLRVIKPAMILLLLLAALHVPAHAEPAEKPSGAAMVADFVVARPLGIAFTAIGSAVFVASLPFSALGGNVDEASELLVLGPARATFVRCLGCTGIYRGRTTDRVEAEPEGSARYLAERASLEAIVPAQRFDDVGMDEPGDVTIEGSDLANEG